MPEASPWTWPALIIAVLAISAAAVLARLAPEVHPVAMAFWRTAAVAALLAPALRHLGDLHEIRLLGVLADEALV